MVGVEVIEDNEHDESGNHGSARDTEDEDAEDDDNSRIRVGPSEPLRLEEAIDALLTLDDSSRCRLDCQSAANRFQRSLNAGASIRALSNASPLQTMSVAGFS